MLVVALLAVMTTVLSTRVDSIAIWRQKSDIRAFVNLWETLFAEAQAQREAYRLVINIDENNYYVRREVVLDPAETVEVDLLSNLRTQGEQERRKQEALERSRDLAEEFEHEDRTLSQGLESLYYKAVYADPEANIRLGTPLNFPSLAETQSLVSGLSIRDVQIFNEKHTEGEVYIRFSPNGSATFAVVHIVAGESVFTAVMNPATGIVTVHPGDKEFEWTLGKNQDSA